MLIKVCGMREPANILAVATTIRPDYMGFIFYLPSPRNITNLHPEVIAQIAAATKPTGVFVNASLEEIAAKTQYYGLQAVQLHGTESPDFCRKCKEKLSIEVLKAFSVATQEDLIAINNYDKAIDFALLDTKGRHAGGNGVAFDWGILKDYTAATPFFLSGGISAENWAEVQHLTYPKMVGVDVNSKFEVSPALKDVEKLKILL